MLRPQDQNRQQSNFPVLKRTLLYFFPPFLLTGLILYAFQVMELRQSKQVTDTREQLHAELISEEISSAMEKVASQLTILAAHQELKKYIEGESFQKEALTNEFVVFSEANRVYNQIRLIDEKGMEKIRVNYFEEQTEVVPENALQDKSNRYYFTETIRLAPSTFYISPADYNFEKGRRQKPLIPVIRFAMPLFNSTNTRKGILIINYRLDSLISRLEEYPSKAPKEYLLLDAGSAMQFESPKNVSAWQLVPSRQSQIAFQNQHAKLWQQIVRSETASGQFYSSEGLTTFKKIYPHQSFLKGLPNQLGGQVIHKITNAPETAWVYVSTIPAAVLYAEPEQFRNKLIAFYCILTLILLSSAIAYSKMSYHRELAEIALIKKEAQHLDLLQNTPYGIQEIDLNGIIVFANRAYHNMLGYEDETLIGINISSVIGKKDLPYVASMIACLGSEVSKPQVYRCSSIKKDHSFIQTEIAWNVKRDGNGIVTGLTSVVTDITSKITAEKFQRLSTAVFENTTEGILIADKDRNIISVNSAFTKITGYPAEEVIGKNPRFLHSGMQDRTFYKRMWAMIESTGRWQGEIWNRKKKWRGLSRMAFH